MTAHTQRAIARPRSLQRRRALSAVMSGLMALAALLATLPLLFLLWHLLREGASAIDLAFFTTMPKPVGEPGGGLAHAITGTLILVGIAAAIGLPVGIGAGLYLAEQREARLATSVRFLSDVLNGMRSSVMGRFSWHKLVWPIGQ